MPIGRSTEVTARWDVLGIGECSCDEVARVDAAPPPGGKAQMHGHARLAGGQIATALLGCARLGHRAAFVSSVGDDASAEVALAPLRAAGVDLAGVRRVPGAETRSAWIWVDARGERTVLWRRDARLALGTDAIARHDVAAARVVLVDATDVGLATHAAVLARSVGRPCIADADAACDGLPGLLATASHPALSEPLAIALYGGAEPALRALARAGATQPIVTRGQAGALAWIAGEAVAIPAFAVDAVDTTGAGDAFRAGLAHGLLLGLSDAALLQRACAVAALACTATGAQGGLPTRDALERFLVRPPAFAPLA